VNDRPGTMINYEHEQLHLSEEQRVLPLRRAA
jgi:hypothetical protein